MLWNMAAGADCSPPFILDSSYVKDSVPTVVKDEVLDIAEEFRQVSIGKPPRHLSDVRQSISSATVAQPNCTEIDISVSQHTSPSTDGRSSFLPVLRSGCCAERGPKQYMEDEHVSIDNVFEQYGETVGFPSPGAFYGVFDGHGGTDAAVFIRKNIFKFIVEDSSFPVCMEKAIKNAFLKADHAFAADSTLDISSGTTALTALLFGRTLVVANAGDCRAVLGKRGRAIELSRDHKPNCASERTRIERLGGAVYDGYLNGQLSVARAIGDWHMKGPEGSSCPLSAEPELQETVLTEDDEFLIIGCDGLWDVMSSQGAVSIARKELMIHNNPERCSRELVREALKRNTCDNLTVIVVCFSHDPPPRLEAAPTRVRRSISAEGLNLLKGVLEMESSF